MGRTAPGHTYTTLLAATSGPSPVMHIRAICAVADVWTPEPERLENPSNYAPGTKMSYPGVGDVEDRANLIAYLATVGPDHEPITLWREGRALRPAFLVRTHFLPNLHAQSS